MEDGRSTGGEPLRPEELAAWQGLLRVALPLRRRLGDALERDHGLTIAEYDVLARLADQPGRRQRLATLSSLELQPRSTITRLVDGLERRGLVARERTEHDGRGFNAVMTRKGARAFDAARADHLDRVREAFLGRLTDAQLHQLAAVWQVLLGDGAGDEPPPLG